MSIKEKIKSIIDTLLGNSRIPAMYRPIIKGMIENYLNDTKEEELREYIIQLRAEFIPWLLGEENAKETTQK